MTVRRVIMGLRVEAVLAGTAWAAMLVVAHPHAAAARLDLAVVPWTMRLFDAGIAVAMVALACLGLRLGARLLATGRRRADTGECRAVAGTVMAEFALILPIVLLIMSLIVQMALIANASLVVRYAAFASCRSAIVNLESNFMQVPPIPTPVVERNPRLAAELVLASLSPERPGNVSAGARAMERMLQAQGGVYGNGHFAERTAYASQGIDTFSTNWHFARLLEMPDHLVPPYRLSQDLDRYYLVLPAATDLVPQQFSITVPLPDLTIKFKVYGVPMRIPLQPPLPKEIDIPVPPALTDPFIGPLTDAVQNVLGLVSGGSGIVLDAWANSAANIDVFGPMRVEVTIEYDFMLSLPSLHFVPGVTLYDAPGMAGRKAFRITHTVELQATQGRRASALALIPWPEQLRKGPIQDNSPIYWVAP